MSSSQLRNDEHSVGNVYGAVNVGGQARVQLGNSYNHITQNVSIRIDSTISTVWKLYKSCRTTPESYCNISQELNSLHAVLKECEEAFSEESRSSDRSARLTIILAGCTDIAEELGAIIQKYEGLGLQQRRTWDRLQWHSDEINEIRARITSHVGMLTAFMTTSQLNIARKLEGLLIEFRRGNMDGSVVSSVTDDSLNGDERAQWRAVRKEFEEHGITVEMFTSQRDFIVQWFAEAVTAGHFDEEKPIDQDNAFLRGDGDSSVDNVQHKVFKSTSPRKNPQSSQQFLTPTHTSAKRDSIRPREPNTVQTHSAHNVKTHPEPSADQGQVSATRVPPPDRQGSGSKVSRIAPVLAKLWPISAMVDSCSKSSDEAATADKITKIFKDNLKWTLLTQRDMDRVLTVACNNSYIDANLVFSMCKGGANPNARVKIPVLDESITCPLEAATNPWALRRPGDDFETRFSKLRVLLEAGAEPAHTNALVFSSCLRWIPHALLLLQAGANINEYSNNIENPVTPLAAGIACYNFLPPPPRATKDEQHQLCNMLLSGGTKPTMETLSNALAAAVICPNPSACQLLVEAGVNMSATFMKQWLQRRHDGGLTYRNLLENMFSTTRKFDFACPRCWTMGGLLEVLSILESTAGEFLANWNTSILEQCEHKVMIKCLLSSVACCCACADNRPYAPEGYPTYQDGRGLTTTWKRWQGYCAACYTHYELISV